MEKKFNLELIISLILILGTILGVTVPLHMGLQEDIRAIHQEIKDFHGRLCAIEERNK